MSEVAIKVAVRVRPFSQREMVRKWRKCDKIEVVDEKKIFLRNKIKEV